jgi:hypothetical protein
MVGWVKIPHKGESTLRVNHLSPIFTQKNDA